MNDAAETDDGLLIELVAEVVSSYVSNNPISVADLPTLIAETHAALKSLSAGEQEVATVELEPAVPIKKSITPDYLICLEDGKKFKSMKRHLRGLGMTPEEYREKWGLPVNYPMVAPNYSAARSSLAKSSGLGRKPT